MQCDKCGSETTVLDTREVDQFTVRRRRVCGGGHRFSTYEILSTAFKRRGRKHFESAEAAQRRVDRHIRDKAIVARVDAGMKHAAVAAEFGIVDSYVSLIYRRSKSCTKTSCAPSSR